jgi:hypothetical protein
LHLQCDKEVKVSDSALEGDDVTFSRLTKDGAQHESETDKRRGTASFDRPGHATRLCTVSLNSTLVTYLIDLHAES